MVFVFGITVVFVEQYYCATFDLDMLEYRLGSRIDIAVDVDEIQHTHVHLWERIGKHTDMDDHPWVIELRHEWLGISPYEIDIAVEVPFLRQTLKRVEQVERHMVHARHEVLGTITTRHAELSPDTIIRSQIYGKRADIVYPLDAM